VQFFTNETVRAVRLRKSSLLEKKKRSCPQTAFPAQPHWRRTMIKVSVMYPNQSGARFDHDYYRNKHMPLVKRLLGDACLYYAIDRGLSGGDAVSPPPYIGMCHIFCESQESFQRAFAPHAEKIMADIPAYTDLTPTLQISEVVVEHS
jgi:uncharacterized protein (TIGR02118 family)